MPSPTPKLIARNVAALRRFGDAASQTATTVGNPVSTRMESAIGNCFPGLECDLRNLERRFFPFLEVDIVGNSITLVSVDRQAVTGALAAGDLNAEDAKTYLRLANHVRAGGTVMVGDIEGTFGPLGALSVALDVPALGLNAASTSNLGTPSVGLGRLPTDAWTAVRLLTEGSKVKLKLVTDGPAEASPLELTAPRARYLDDNGTLATAFLPGELSQSLCSPWTHDFRDCGCFYWASNHPDIVQPVRPPGAPASASWNAAVDWERSNRAIGPAAPSQAVETGPDSRDDQRRELRHHEISARWQELHFVVARREIVNPFSQDAVIGSPFASLGELLVNLRYASGVELAVAQEYLAAAYSLKADTDPSLAGRPELADDIRAARAEIMRIAIGEMRHTRVVNDVIRGLSPAGAFEPALQVAGQVPHTPGPYRQVVPRAATGQAIDDFIQIEAQSAGVDGLYNNILATLEFPPVDVAPLVTDEWKQAIRSVIAEGEDHFETFLNIKEWLGRHGEGDYLRAQALAPPPKGDADHLALQAAYKTLLETLHTGYRKGRFPGAGEINAARAAMVGAGGISDMAEAVAGRNFLVVFVTPNDPRFTAVDPPPPRTS